MLCCFRSQGQIPMMCPVEAHEYRHHVITRYLESSIGQGSRTSPWRQSTPKRGVSYTFQSANRGKGQARLDYILTKQADRRLVRCVNVRPPPLESPQSDHNLVYATVRIPRRSAPNRRRREGTTATPKTADLQRLMADPNFRRHVVNATSAALPPIPNGNCMAEVMLPIAAKLAQRLKRPREPQGWCVDLGYRLR